MRCPLVHAAVCAGAPVAREAARGTGRRRAALHSACVPAVTRSSPNPMRRIQPTTPRDYILWMGPTTGLLAAWVWGDRSSAWLLAGLAIGYAAEFAALRVASREKSPGEAAIAFFVAFLTLITVVPFLAIGGLLSFRGAVVAAFAPYQLLLIPAAALMLAAAHHSRTAAADTRAPRRHGKRPRRSDRWLWIFGATALVIALGAAHARVPAPYSLDFLYLLPVLLVTNAAGRQAGLLVAGLSAEARGIARGLSYDGPLDPGPTALDSLLIAAGLASAAILLARIQRGLEREHAAARTDALTGLMNRKAFLERLETEVSRAGRHDRPLSIAYLDLDGFKAVNDTFGHAAGDEVLRIVAGVLLASIRGEDVAARFGGDEFAILLPETDPDLAPRVIERVRSEVEDRMHAFSWQVTCSVGLVTSTQPDASVDTLLVRADELMYQVKHEGKNALRQVFISA